MFKSAPPPTFVHVIFHDWLKEGRQKQKYKGDEGLQKLVLVYEDTRVERHIDIFD